RSYGDWSSDVCSSDLRLDGVVVGARAPTLPDMSAAEVIAADLWATGMSPAGDPVALVRDQLDAWGATTATALADAEPDSRVLVEIGRASCRERVWGRG